VAFPESIWLRLNKAKVLLGLGRNEEALKFALDVTRAKVNDFWTWELLGDISADSDNEVSLSCYCKALLCSSDDKFTGKVRMKLAKSLIAIGDFAEAKQEVSRVVTFRNREKFKIPPDIEKIVAQPWYSEISKTDSNDNFYKVHVVEAETLLFSQLPWIDSSVGEVFSLPAKEDKPKRKLFIKTSSEPIEVVIPEKKFALSDVEIGEAIRVKGEVDSKQRFQVYLVTKRDRGERWDVFTERVGVVDHVNKQKKLIHFIVDRNVDGVIPFSEINEPLREGDSIAVKLSKYITKQGTRFRVLAAVKTKKEPGSSIRKTFNESVRINNGLGFTSTDIFIPPPLVSREDIKDDDIVSGVALLNYDRKHGNWGWKAISIDKINHN